MASTAFDSERRGALDAQVADLRIAVATLEGRADRQDQRIGHATIVAYVAAIGGLLIGVLDFALLITLLGRLT
jgi:hypothetical protein